MTANSPAIRKTPGALRLQDPGSNRTWASSPSSRSCRVRSARAMNCTIPSPADGAPSTSSSSWTARTATPSTSWLPRHRRDAQAERHADQPRSARRARFYSTRSTSRLAPANRNIKEQGRRRKNKPSCRRSIREDPTLEVDYNELKQVLFGSRRIAPWPSRNGG